MSDEQPTTTEPAEGEGSEDWQAKLDAQKKVNRDLERKTKADLKRLEALEAELAQLREGSAPKDEVATQIEKAKKDAARGAQAAANRRIVAAEVKAAAAGKLANPADALAFLSLDDFEVGDDLEVDAKAIGEALDDLLKERPYLAAQQTGTWAGTADGGYRGEPAPADTSPRGLIYAGLKVGKRK